MEQSHCANFVSFTFHLTSRISLCVCVCVCVCTLTFHFADEEMEIKWLNQCHTAYYLVMAGLESRTPDQMPSQTYLLLFCLIQQTFWGFSGKKIPETANSRAFQNLISHTPHFCLPLFITRYDEGSNKRLSVQAWPAFPHCFLDLSSLLSLTENMMFLVWTLISDFSILYVFNQTLQYRQQCLLSLNLEYKI